MGGVGRLCDCVVGGESILVVVALVLNNYQRACFMAVF
jgi:hypothetical protein